MESKQSKSGIRLKYVIITVFSVAVLIVISGCDRNASKKGWKTYRHDASRTAVTSEDIPYQPVLKWIYTPVHGPKQAWSEPAEEMARAHSDNTFHVTASNGIAYFGSSVDRKVYALDIATGKGKWTFFTEGPIRFSPTLWKDCVYFGSDDGHVYCLKAKSGKLVWKYRPGPKDKKVIGNGNMISLWPVRTSVLIEDNTVYFGAGVFPYDGLYLCALNAKDGSVIWKNDDLDDESFELRYGGISPQSYIIASKTKLFVPSGRALPAVFDRKTGKFLQYLPSSGKQGGTWGMLDQGELVTGVDRSGAPVKVSFDAETGEQKGDVLASISNIDMVSSKNISYVVSTQGIYAVDRLKFPVIRQKIDSVNKEQNRITGLARGIIGRSIIENNPHSERAFDSLSLILDALTKREEKLNSSTSKWFFPSENLASIILTGNQVITGGKDIVIGLERETGKELWRQEVKGTAYGLSVSDHNLLVSTDQGPIYCFSEGSENSVVSDEELTTPSILKESPYSNDKMTGIYEKAAELILKETSIDKGYCLVLDAGEGQLVYELAKRSHLNIIGIEKDPAKVEIAKSKLDKAGIYGVNSIVENWTIQSLPSYFADLIVSGDMIEPVKTGNPSDELFRVLKPGGGVAYFGQLETENTSLKIADLESITNEWGSFSVEKPEIINRNGNWIRITRKELSGAGGWTHQYADLSNTLCSDDKLVKAPFRTLWYGDPGPQTMVERHARSASPISYKGKLFIEGENLIMAYDVYNGIKLWERKIEGANRVRVDADGGNMAINQNGLFVAINDKCLQLNIETGETIKTFSLPSAWKDKSRRWGYIAVKDNILFGSVAMPMKMGYNQIFTELVDENGNWKDPEDLDPATAIFLEYYQTGGIEKTEEIKQAFQRDGAEWRSITDFPAWSPGINGIHGTTDRIMASDGIFATDISTGKNLWIYRGNKIAQITISIGDGTMYFADVVSNQQKILNAIKDRQNNVTSGKYEPFDSEVNANNADVRDVHALDMLTGREKWVKCVDLSGCGDDFTASGYRNGVLLFFGSYGLHDKYRFPAGELKWHRITALSTIKGDLIWSRQLNYMVRPLIINDEVIVEPRKCNLYTGEIITRTSPVTGHQVPWEFYRPGHTCAATSGNENCLFYRSDITAYYDLKEDKGISYYGAYRPGCWINIVPGNGLVSIPESSSGCTCSYPVRSTVVLMPENNEEVEDWSLYVSNTPITPVKHLAINLGAPGDKKSKDGTIWFGYPRPASATGLKFNIHEDILKDMGYFSYDSKNVTIEGTVDPWLFTSGCIGLTNCEIQLIDDLLGEDPGVYTVRLGFIPSSTHRKFSVKLQDKTVLDNLDILKEAGNLNLAVIKEIKGVNVTNFLKLELVPANANPDFKNAPAINFIEVMREDKSGSGEPFIAKEQLSISQIQNLLAQAKEELGKNNLDGSREKLEIVLNSKASTKNDKLEALANLKVIGSSKSLPAIKKYLQKLNPVMWNYKEPDGELTDAAVKVYLAIATKLGDEKDNSAVNMINRTFSLTRNFDIRYTAIKELKDLGSSPGKEFEENNFVDHLACGKRALLSGTYEQTILTDGIKGTINYNIDWQNVAGVDLNATIDLGESKEICKISVGFLQNINRRIFLPEKLEFSISGDGKDFKLLSIKENDTPLNQGDSFIKEFTFDFDRTKARYVRIHAKNISKCPLWHTNSGEEAFLYCDEIQVL